MGLRETLNVLIRRRWILASSIILMVAISIAYSVLQTPIYEASAEVLVQPRGQDSLFNNQSASLSERALQTEMRFIEGAAVQARVAEDLATTDPPDVDARAIGDTDAVQIAVRDTDPEIARAAADAYAIAYIEVRREQSVAELLAAGTEVQAAIDNIEAQLADIADDDVQRSTLLSQLANFETTLDELRVDAALRTGGAAIIRPAELPESPVEPTPARNIAFATAFGIMVGVAMAFVLEHLDDKVRHEAELEEASGEPVLAVVPAGPRNRSGPDRMGPLRHDSEEAYRALATNLQFFQIDKPLTSIQVTSSIAQEGKTTTAAHLAIALAESGHRVVVIDADLRRPRLHQLFMLQQRPGLTEVLRGHDPIDAIQRVPVDGGPDLEVVTSGAVPTKPAQVFSGSRFGALLEKLQTDHDFLIIDSAPVLPVSDSLGLAGAVDGILVVAEAGRVSIADVNETLSRLNRIDAPVLGLVLNKLRKGPAVRYQYGGYTAPSPKDS